MVYRCQGGLRRQRTYPNIAIEAAMLLLGMPASYLVA